jgi:hypothetical protein
VCNDTDLLNDATSSHMSHVTLLPPTFGRVKMTRHRCKDPRLESRELHSLQSLLSSKLFLQRVLPCSPHIAHISQTHTPPFPPSPQRRDARSVLTGLSIASRSLGFTRYVVTNLVLVFLKTTFFHLEANRIFSSPIAPTPPPTHTTRSPVSPPQAGPSNSTIQQHATRVSLPRSHSFPSSDSFSHIVCTPLQHPQPQPIAYYALQALRHPISFFHPHFLLCALSLSGSPLSSQYPFVYLHRTL